MPRDHASQAMQAGDGVHQAHISHASHTMHGANGDASAAAQVSMTQDHAMHETHADHSSRSGHNGHSGHDAHAGHGGMHEGHITLMRDRFWISLVLTIPVLIYAPMIQQWLNFTAPQFPGSGFIAPVLGTLIFVLGGLPFLDMARGELASRQPGMMTLISIAIITAYVYSLGVFLFPPVDAAGMPMAAMDFFWELATLITIMLLGHWIELRSVSQAQGALRELARLLPDTAERIQAGGSTEIVAVSELRAGDRVLVRPGTSVPADGVVVDGESSVNESMITGESKPVHKQAGEKVIGGTVNGAGALRVEIQQVGEQTALAGIMRLVAEAQQSTSRAQTLAQRAAFYLTLIALTAGALTFAGWLYFTGSVPDAVKYTVGVLVIACPHALGLAVPLVVSISTTLAARNGLLVRQRLALESAKDLDIVIFDKTGTLTKGEQGVVSIAVDGIRHEDAVAIAAGIEGDSEHIIARAIRDYATQQDITPAPVTGFQSLPGRGVQALVGGRRYAVGGPRLLEQQGWQVPAALEEARRAAEEAGQAVIYLAGPDGVVALFAVADVIRPESREAIEQLHAMGIKVAMLTGDSEAVAKSVAQELGIDTYFAQVLPEHKAEKVRQLQQGGARVAMVGDGVNDAPALATADVAIAIGAGTDVAIESAGIILARSNPLDIVKIVRLSRHTYGKMVQNLLWATGYNAVAIPLAMGVLAPVGILLDPAVGAVFMSASTVIVALNAQLLRRLKLA
ncbi:MAG: heavy metal translocating P-type ATPase [Caldilineaceae bacterium]|nr:heavy metal translocating P-type ATPase [Caldilineaceae bacterium]